MTGENLGHRFDRVPATVAEREARDRPTRREIIAWFEDRYGIPPTTFENYSFWEKGSGKIWAFAGELPTPQAIEALGLHVLRTNQRNWKPTTDAMQRFGNRAERNVLVLPRDRAARFWRGETQSIEEEGEPGYVIVAHELAGAIEPLGVGLAVRGELRSQIPKARRRDLSQ